MNVSGRIALLLGSAAILGGVASEAFAGAFALREQSSYGQGMSFAGVAAGGSLSSSFWNPAVLSQVMGFEAELGGTLIVPTIKVTPTAATVATLDALSGGFAATSASGDMGQDAFAPVGYVAYRINESLIAGIGVNSPFGLATNPETSWAGQAYSRTSKVFSVNVNPMIAYQLNEMISIGAGLQVQYFKTSLKTATGVLPGDPTADLSGDDTSVGFTAGIQVRPFAGTEIGLGFRSSIRQSLEGTLELPGSQPLPIDADLDMPETVSLGLRQRITDAFTLAGTVEWTNWSRFGDVAVTSPLLGGAPVDLNAFQAGAQGLSFQYDDGWFFSVGGEYAWTPATSLRAGIGYELSPISDKVRSTRLADDDRLWLSAGLSHSFNERFSFDFAYSYVRAMDPDIDISSASNPSFNGLPFVAEGESDLHFISAALKVKLGGGARPVFESYEEPAVRKF
ncbi:OmpP1/FadL family transporter [Propylenella binzhouense]|nr:outer membrane protein transport protein [Propylenella binzhouense]